MKQTMILTTLLAICILLCSGILSTAHTSTQQTLSSGSSPFLFWYVGGSGPGNFTQIQDAIDNASNGDTIFVYDDSSPYFEHLSIQKQINLIGENKETTISNSLENSQYHP